MLRGLGHDRGDGAVDPRRHARRPRRLARAGQVVAATRTGQPGHPCRRGGRPARPGTASVGRRRHRTGRRHQADPGPVHRLSPADRPTARCAGGVLDVRRDRRGRVRGAAQRLGLLLVAAGLRRHRADLERPGGQHQPAWPVHSPALAGRRGDRGGRRAHARGLGDRDAGVATRPSGARHRGRRHGVGRRVAVQLESSLGVVGAVGGSPRTPCPRHRQPVVACRAVRGVGDVRGLVRLGRGRHAGDGAPVDPPRRHVGRVAARGLPAGVRDRRWWPRRGGCAGRTGTTT